METGNKIDNLFLVKIIKDVFRLWNYKTNLFANF